MGAIFKVLEGYFRKLVHHFEHNDAPLWYFIFTFFAAVLLRSFLELFSDNIPAQPAAAHAVVFLFGTQTLDAVLILAHFTLFYMALGLTLILVIHALLRENIGRLFRLISSGFLVLLTVPAVDLLLSRGKGYNLGYLFAESFGDFFYQFITFFGSVAGAGISPGMRAEILLVTLFFFLYARSKGHGYIKSAAAAAIAYATIFFYVAIPYPYEAVLRAFSVAAQYSDIVMIRFFMCVVLACLGILALLFSKKNTLVVLRDIRLPRLLHYWLMFMLGLLLAHKAQGSLPFTSENFLSIPLVLISIASAWGFSVATNNMTDESIDTVSNPGRPLVSGAISRSTYTSIAWILLSAALVTALTVGGKILFLIALFLGNYFLYSMPPLRLKRVPVFSKLFILLNSAIILLAGFMLIYPVGYQDTMAFLKILFSPLTAPMIAVILATLLLAANFLDLKDYSGDKKAGIKTLPVLLGMRTSQFVIGGTMFLLYALIGYTGHNSFLYMGCILFGGLQFYLITKKAYVELHVFVVYLLSLVALFFFL